MKIMLTATLTVCVLLVGCQSSPGGSAGTPTRTKSFKYSTDDGTTQATAVEVRTHSGTEGGVLIKDWIRANHPGYTIAEQELMPDKILQKMYNIVTIIGPTNSAKRVYFDVTQFYQSGSGTLPSARFPPPR
jgi:hypothetical protein